MGNCCSQQRDDYQMKRDEPYPIGDVRGTIIQNILVVDDVVANGNIIREYFDLGDYDVKVLSVTSGTKALEANKQTDFDIIFMDIKMIGMDGYETTKALRDEGFDGCIVGMSGMIDILSINKAYRNGMNAMLPKPVIFEDLISKLHSFGYRLNKH